MSAQPKHDVFQAVADPTRRQLLQLLAGRELPVTAISSHFPISRTAVSKHLRVLAEAGLVKERRIGRETRYRMEAEPLLELKKWLDFYERFWENKLEALRRYVESGEPEGDSLGGPRGIPGAADEERP
ncbi:ArsR/SmtB family transcription factor [Paenibacillus mucilaginosus]|uniref:ArsR family transcriptional regulator n=3 Tax=Paenibacillus mucilaginosus TaxID=61624 RepID=H6NGQ4_9BACL|nr:metalloregulator ArsR/SmtB family transcription factor [Paenibacillus mucilaginosus]AEI46357.1 transcriptional regulator, ArsR family [Paenibacillus mucilaginosus KNP414]AFC33957.1 ArsR family transcriptional regulator [Paenibacillus mucilaginosus 3016]AFH66289.2 ArsR family transcriptional regulator [Paenibacillus mucilaginosus K02]MCG7213530.1 metalloregulator ArsR/SmtB family transcription factor [Paenibacillus mucilaginosus]WDM27654.1 winged helix-turn-helix transcriptional regulator [P